MRRQRTSTPTCRNMPIRINPNPLKGDQLSAVQLPHEITDSYCLRYPEPTTLLYANWVLGQGTGNANVFRRRDARGPKLTSGRCGASSRLRSMPHLRWAADNTCTGRPSRTIRGRCRSWGSTPWTCPRGRRKAERAAPSTSLCGVSSFGSGNQLLFLLTVWLNGARAKTVREREQGLYLSRLLLPLPCRCRGGWSGCALLFARRPKSARWSKNRSRRETVFCITWGYLID